MSKPDCLPATPIALREPPQRCAAAVVQLVQLLPGSLLSGVIALAATAVGLLQGGPVLLYALFFGIAFSYLGHEERTQPGVEFCARQVLRLGVGLLGARITASQIAALGLPTMLVVAGAMIATIALGGLLGRRFGLTRAQGLLTGGSVGICGASAALAISAVLPRDRDSERFTLMVVVCVTVMSTVAMVLYPPVAHALALPPQLAGLFIGGTIHDVAQVAGAGYTLGPQTGDIAIIVKLFRVSMLAVVVLALTMAFRQHTQARATGARAGGRAPLVPWFMWMFIAMVAVNSAGWMPAATQGALNTVSRAALVVAIAGLGVKTSIAQLAELGWRPVMLLLIETLWLAAWVLGYILTQR